MPEVSACDTACDDSPPASAGPTPTACVEPFAGSLQHLLAEIERLDLLVRIQVFRARRIANSDALRGLAISEDEVDGLLSRPVGQPSWFATPVPPAMVKVLDIARQKGEEIERRRAHSEHLAIELRLSRLARLFDLSSFERDILLAAVAPDIDTRYERLFAYLNDDVTRKRPTVDVILSLLCDTLEERLTQRHTLLPTAPLLRHELLELVSDTSSRSSDSLLARAVKVDERIVTYLHDSDEIDVRLLPYAAVVQPTLDLESLALPHELKQRLRRFVSRAQPATAPAPVIHLHGPYGVGKRSAAEALCRELGLRLLVVSGDALAVAGDEPLHLPLCRFGREALLQHAAILWEGADALLGSERPAIRDGFITALQRFSGLTFVAGTSPWEANASFRRRPFIQVEIPRPSASQQCAIWSAALADRGVEDVDLKQLTSTYRLTGGEIRDAVAAAEHLACLRDPDTGSLTTADLSQACKLRTRRKLSALAQKVPTHFRWDDLVLPEDRVAQLREICLHIKHRTRVLDAWGFDRKLALGKGLAALFSGPPGTGKTMAASVIAAELGVDLYRIDLSLVVSKYIGETEKHLAELFADAEACHAALLFDEADAIFGKRTEVHDAHDRYANIETSYLLQRIETFEGIVVLASNLTKNLDEAFVRRLRFIVEFPFPSPAERLRIWQGIWPKEVPAAADLDLEHLARTLELSGGSIRNVAVAAAFLAADTTKVVGIDHVMRAAKREFQKMGKVVDAAVFEPPPVARANHARTQRSRPAR